MHLFIPTLLALTLVGCNEEEIDPTPQDFSDCDNTGGDAYDFGTVNIDGENDESYIEDDTLIVPVSYGGGCEDHTFVICWPEQAFLE